MERNLTGLRTRISCAKAYVIDVMGSGQMVDVAFAVDRLAGVGQILRGAARESFTEEAASAWASALAKKR